MRSLMLRYMLYDALIRPDEWHFALIHDEQRTAAWLAAVLIDMKERFSSSVFFQEHMPRILFLSNSGELPILPLLLASYLPQKLSELNTSPCGVNIQIVEPLTPVAAAIKECIEDNDLEELVSITSTADRGKSEESGQTPDEPVDLLIVPGLEDPSRFLAVLEDLESAVEGGVLHSNSRILPSRTRLVAAGLQVEAQTNPVRAPLGRISGFDMLDFNALRGPRSTPDVVRLRDIKHEMLTQPVELKSFQFTNNGDGTFGDDSSWKLQPGEWEVPLSIIADGQCSAIAVWMETEMLSS
ncbi:hypothetical protein CYMTET_53509, partial [Cymbomonas tetramitiformis]